MADEVASTPVETTTTESAPAASDTSSSSANSPVQSSVATSPAADFPTHDKFGWDEWDGTHDKLPEPVRGWAQKFEGHYSKESKAAIAEATELRELYERLTSGIEDPRVATTKAEYEKYKTEQTAALSELKSKLSEYQHWEKELNKLEDEKASQAVEKFKADHDWIFDGGKVEAAASDLVDEGFAADEIAQVLRLPEFLQTEVRKINKELTAKGAKDASGMAIRIARAEARFEAPASESLQAGPGNRVTTKITTELPATSDFAERRQRAIEKANKTMAG